MKNHVYNIQLYRLDMAVFPPMKLKIKNTIVQPGYIKQMDANR